MRLSHTAVPASPDPPTPVSRLSLRFATLGGGIAWLAHLVLAYVVAEFGCVSGLGRVQWQGLSVVTWMLLGMTVLTLGLALAATLVAWRNRRRLLRAWGERSESHEAEDFTSRLAFITDALFVGIIVVQSVPILYFLPAC
jgi:hypothetical protein